MTAKKNFPINQQQPATTSAEIKSKEVLNRHRQIRRMLQVKKLAAEPGNRINAEKSVMVGDK